MPESCTRMKAGNARTFRERIRKPRTPVLSISEIRAENSRALYGFRIRIAVAEDTRAGSLVDQIWSWVLRAGPFYTWDPEWWPRKAALIERVARSTRRGARTLGAERARCGCGTLGAVCARCGRGMRGAVCAWCGRGTLGAMCARCGRGTLFTSKLKTNHGTMNYIHLFTVSDVSSQV